MKKNIAVVRVVFSMLALSVLMLLTPAAMAEVAIGISVRVGPPALPVYAQPICPGPGYMWVPGYWAWNDVAGYYWVPGTWVMAPVGMLWTPGYWGWNEGFYVWHAGYWGPHVGFYGGINYGFGYGGVGFWGGEWRGRNFFYNRSVTNVNVTNVTNVYNKTVIVNNTTVNRVSYNGGTGGVMARPTPQEMAAEREPHRAALATQMQHEQTASRNRQLFASENHGRPAIAATGRPGEFRGHDVMAARAAGAPYHAPAMSPREARGPSPNAMHAGNAASGGTANEGFRKFGQPGKNETTNAGGAGNGNKGGNWNANVARPGNAGNGKQNANADAGYQKFGHGAQGNKGPQNGNNNWRANNASHAGGGSANMSRQNQARVENRAHVSAPPHQNAPKAGPPPKANQQRERPEREKERHPGAGV
jgi:hypothetical protein